MVCHLSSNATRHIEPALKSAKLGAWIGKSHQHYKAQLVSPTAIYYDNSIFTLYKGDRFHRSDIQHSPQANAPPVAILPTNENSIQLLDISSFDIDALPKWMTVSKLLLMDKSPNAICPLCKEANENQQHVPHCQHASAIAARQVAIATFKQALLSYNTPPALTELLSHILTSGSCDDDVIKAYICAYPTMQHKLYAAIDNQTSIGLHNMQAGLLATSWAHLIHAHYQTANIKNRHSTSWMRHVVGDALTYTHATWVHRCETTNEPGDIALKTYRLKLLTEFKTLQIDPTPIGSFKSLLRRSDDFFKRQVEDQLKAWEAKVSDAKRKTAQGKKKRKGVKRHFPTVRVRPARRVRLFPTSRKNRQRTRKEKKARRAKIIHQSNILKYCGLVQQQPPEPYATTPKLVPPLPNIC